MSGRAQAWVAAPPADASRVASIRNTIDLTDATALAMFGDRARRELTTCVDRLLAEVRSSDLTDAEARLGQAQDAARGIDLAPLDKKGWFGGGERRRAVKSRFLTADAVADGLAGELWERQQRMTRRVATLEALHGQTQVCILELDAYLEAGREAVAAAPRTLAPVGEEDAPVVQVAPVEQTGTLARRLEQLAAVREAALRQLPLVRVVQNVDGPVAAALQGACDAIGAWRRDWRELLGVESARKMRPDRLMLDQTREALLTALEAVRRPAADGRGRREDAERRMQEHAQTVRHTAA